MQGRVRMTPTSTPTRPQLTANTTAGCCDKCRANPKCKSWTYHPTGASKTICYLHGAVGPSSTQDPSVISGVPHGVAPKHPVRPPPPPQPRTCGPEVSAITRTCHRAMPHYGRYVLRY
jgi:hypothetical protein